MQGNTKQKKAALIELGGSHSETLYSQLLFLKHGGYHTTLIVDERVYKQVVTHDHVDVLINAPMLTPLPQRIKTLWGIRSYIIKNSIDTVIFNTAGGPLVRMLTMMPYPARVRFAGTLHSLHKLKGSVTQKLISRRIKKYFLLDRHLKDKAKEYSRRGLSFESYYAMFYMPFPDQPAIHKPMGETWIAIPGVVEYVRKDYKSLAEALAKLPEPLPLKFLLLGSSFHKSGDGADFTSLIERLNVKNYFKFWEGFVSNEEFHAYGKVSDAVMPLIHPKDGERNVYIDYQISGAWNLAFAYKKPLLLAAPFKQVKDLNRYGVFYDVDKLAELLKSLPELLARLDTGLYEDEPWQFEYQANNYLKFIEAD